MTDIIIEQNDTISEAIHLPVIALRGLVIFPGVSIQFDVGRKKSMLAINAAMERGQKIFLAAQRDLEDNEPDYDQMYHMGVIAHIKQVFRHSEDGFRLLVEGLYRATLLDLVQESPFLIGCIQVEGTKDVRHTPRVEALMRRTQDLFDQYTQNYKHVPPDIIVNVMRQKSAGRLADFIASNLSLDYEDKQVVLEELHPVRRLEKLIAILEQEIKVLEIENEITTKAREQMDQSQREYYLREQMKAIAFELGEDESPQDEADEFREKILQLQLPELQTEKLLKECSRLARMSSSSHEYGVLRNYIETCVDLPWNTSSKVNLDLAKAERVLTREHYGLEKVKEQILESLAVRKLAPDSHGQIICLVGPPGVGKTSVARSIAKAIGVKYVRISLGGLRDEAEIVGHRKTYVGAMPGRIIAAIKQAGTNNPLILLDEIDKLCRDFRGDPASALLEVLDPEQNATFHDHYIDMPFDLSKVLFFTTANDISTIPAPLRDRMDVISLSSYTHEEKFQIAVKHLIPKQIKKHGMTAKQLKIQKAAVRDIIDGYTKEAGGARSGAEHREDLPQSGPCPGGGSGSRNFGDPAKSGGISGSPEVSPGYGFQNQSGRFGQRVGLDQRGRGNSPDRSCGNEGQRQAGADRQPGKRHERIRACGCELCAYADRYPGASGQFSHFHGYPYPCAGRSHPKRRSFRGYCHGHGDYVGII